MARAERETNGASGRVGRGRVGRGSARRAHLDLRAQEREAFREEVNRATAALRHADVSAQLLLLELELLLALLVVPKRHLLALALEHHLLRLPRLALRLALLARALHLLELLRELGALALEGVGASGALVAVELLVALDLLAPHECLRQVAVVPRVGLVGVCAARRGDRGVSGGTRLGGGAVVWRRRPPPRRRQRSWPTGVGARVHAFCAHPISWSVSRARFASFLASRRARFSSSVSSRWRWCLSCLSCLSLPISPPGVARQHGGEQRRVAGACV